ncbi:MAG: tetratricopeptide repeat protein [Leptospiraceae bacterium]|nr:tetratricopeptide repeat protein [Leptospiraceae bacterium]
MKIIYRIDEFLYQIFPGLKGISKDKEIIKTLQETFSVEGHVPSIQIIDGFIHIDLADDQVKETQTLSQIIKNAENGHFEKAKDLIKDLIQHGTKNSEVFRIYGQILSDEGDQEEGVNQLIEALKWDPQNTNALIMMGNIYASFHNDIEVAEIYYRKVLEHESKNYIALNNIAGIIAKSGNLEKALTYFEKAFEINPKYPNSLYGLALTLYNLGDFHGAFEKASMTLKIINDQKVKDQNLLRSCQSLQLEIAKAVLSETDEDLLFGPFLHQLEQQTSKNIDVVIDDNIGTPAKIEIAEYRGNPNHTIRYKKTTPGYAHLVFHELTHLELIDEARKENENYLFTSTAKNEATFFKRAEKDKKKMIKGGLTEVNYRHFLKQMFNGINLQIYNAPIDLFIEQRLYDRYPELRPIQFLSLLGLHSQAIAGANDPTAKKIAPDFVRDANIILTYTQLFQLEELFGIDLVDQIKEPVLFKKAKSIYEEYLKMKDDREGGEEYDLIKWWADDLNLSAYFTLEHENQTTPKKEKPDTGTNLKFAEDILAEIENDPYNLETHTAFEEEKMKKFVEANQKQGMNMAVMMHMLGALQYFSNKSKEKAKEVGFEVAELGRLGIDPHEKERYSLSSVPGQSFSGWKLLAYMYVSWAIFDPSMVAHLQLDFEEEYNLAKGLLKQ